jgi:hypothetical protein
VNPTRSIGVGVYQSIVSALKRPENCDARSACARRAKHSLALVD